MMAGFDPDVFGAPSGGASGSFDADVFSSPVKEAKSTLTPKKGTGSDVLDAGNALGTGFFRGLTRLAGLPADTAANVLDLGKAALGTPFLLAGKAPPKALEIGNRADVLGSGDNLIRAATRTQAGKLMLDPANPDYEGGYTQTAGAGLTAIINPNSVPQAVNQGVMGVTSALAGQAAMQATGNPAWAVAASLAPSGIQQALTAGTKAAVLGANPFSEKDLQAKRAEMGDRVTTLRNAGIDKPTLGLATGNRLIGGVENLLQSTPGAVGVMGRSRDAALAGLQGKAAEAADLASTNRGTLEAGTGIQSGINTAFKDRFKATQGQLYDRLEQKVGSQFPTNVDNTRGTLSALNQDIPGAPALSQFFKNGKIQALEGALRSDLSGAPASVQVYAQPPKAGGGIMNAPIPQEPLQVVIPAYPNRTTLPFEAVKKTRTMVGNEIADSTIVSDVPRSKWNPLYGALSEDMGNAARAADRASSSLVPEATNAFNRASNYTRSGMDRLDRVAPLAGAVAPEQAFTAMERAARENVSTLQAVKKTLPQDVRGQIAGTVIDRLGTATAGQQNAAGTAWSPETFLTNWNKMTPRARQELFSGFPNSAQVMDNVENVAKATAMMRDSSKMWANPSGSGANLAARGMLAGIGIGGGASAAGLLNPLVPLGVATAMGGANLLGRSLTSPFVVNEMMKGNTVSPQLLGAQVVPMFSSGLLSN